ncbi:MAG: Prevent-host-death protein [Gammaproteobacteria bacterium]|nr:Prevent-host-death protein [Gammaproteobacteria bacterium]MDE2346050.1 Prevent-host-death protein [Gammaproteobacteria bacterium]
MPSILAAAASGRTTIITRHGHTVAAEVPATAVRQLRPISLLALAGTGHGLWGRSSARAVGKLRDEWTR